MRRSPPRGPLGPTPPSTTPRFLVLFAALYALVVHSAFFATSDWMLGDLAYHRGVAYTMQAGKLVGEGPYAGLITYYGGLFPLAIGWLAAVVDTTFDAILSVVSWLAGPVWVLILWVLGRRLWPADRLTAAVFVVLGTVAAPLTNDRTLLWVESTLVSSHDFWPLFPRDIALMLLVVVAATSLSLSSRVRIVGAGLAIGAMVTFHLQLAILAGALVTGHAVARTLALRERRTWIDVALTGAIALAVSSWWWLPRAGAMIASRRLLLADYPGRLPLRLDIPDYFVGLGVVGLLSVLGFALLATPRLRDRGSLLLLSWAGLLVALIGLDRLTGGLDLISERRLWVVFALPATGAAAVAAVAIARVLPRRAMAAFILAGLVLPQIVGTSATLGVVRSAWVAGEVGGRELDLATWRPLMSQLNEINRSRGGVVVATYDAYTPWAWSFSGAQLVSSWLPGPFKLGFIPERVTGFSSEQRLDAIRDGFGTGLRGMCSTATTYDADLFLLDAEAGLVATHDITPAMTYRVRPIERSRASIDRQVAPGVVYRDLNAYDIVILRAGATYTVPWTSPELRRLTFEVDLPSGAEPAMQVAIDGVATTFPGFAVEGRTRVAVETPVGVRSGVVVRALRDLRLFRVSGFERVEFQPAVDGPFIVEAATVCPPQP